MSKKKVTYKDPKEASIWLDAALENERHKYVKAPVNHHEVVDEYIAADAWGFVALGYFLLEMSLKLQLHMLQQQSRKTHSLLKLFQQLPEKHRHTLSEYYDDFRSNSGGNNAGFPFETLEKYLKDLDGQNDKGFSDWRYYLIEEKQGLQIPIVSIQFLHEIIYGSNRLVGQLCNPRWDAHDYTFSKRPRSQSASRPVAYSTGGDRTHGPNKGTTEPATLFAGIRGDDGAGMQPVRN